MSNEKQCTERYMHITVCQCYYETVVWKAASVLLCHKYYKFQAYVYVYMELVRKGKKIVSTVYLVFIKHGFKVLIYIHNITFSNVRA